MRKAVPTDLRDVTGKNFLETTLGTGEMDVAISRRNAQLAARDQMFAHLSTFCPAGQSSERDHQVTTDHADGR
ncbi:MAG: DUF6538 domain-containing protein [Anderseniella sp.]